MRGYWNEDDSKRFQSMRESLEAGMSKVLPESPDGFLRYRLIIRPYGTLWVEAVFRNGTPGKAMTDYAESLGAAVKRIVPAGLDTIRAVVLTT